MGAFILKSERTLRLLIIVAVCTSFVAAQQNPVFPGWYADPEGVIYDDKYWIFPTFSSDEQLHFDAFSSSDLANWTMHPRIIDNLEVTWAWKSMWAPSALRKDGKYYFFFSANAIDEETHLGGIGVAVSDKPEGPYKDLLGKPLINAIANRAQPIDQFVFQDVDGTYYMFYGGWGRCNLVKLNDDFTSIVPFDDGELYKEVTPEGYVEGPFMFIRNAIYYFMWSEGGWTGPDYKVAYAMSNSVFGPFERIETILEQDSTIATGAGHHSVLEIPGEDKWFMVYHRRPLNETAANHRVTCVDEMHFDSDGYIEQIKMTFEGVIYPLSTK